MAAKTPVVSGSAIIAWFTPLLTRCGSSRSNVFGIGEKSIAEFCPLRVPRSRFLPASRYPKSRVHLLTAVLFGEIFCPQRARASAQDFGSGSASQQLSQQRSRFFFFMIRDPCLLDCRDHLFHRLGHTRLLGRIRRRDQSFRFGSAEVLIENDPDGRFAAGFDQFNSGLADAGMTL